MTIKHTLKISYFKIILLTALLAALVLVTSCYSGKSQKIDPVVLATTQAQIVCDAINELYGDSELKFELKKSRINDPIVQLLCIRNKGLILPGSEPIPRPVPVAKLMQKAAKKVDKKKLRRNKTHEHEDTMQQTIK